MGVGKIAGCVFNGFKVAVGVWDDLLVVELEVHAVVHFVVPQGDVVLEDGVPLLQHDLVPPENKFGNFQK